MDYIPQLLLSKGRAFYAFGKIAITRCLVIGIVVPVLVSLVATIGWGSRVIMYCLQLHCDYTIVNILMAAAYICFLVGLVGIPFYFAGLHYLGLGQIAENTKK